MKTRRALALCGNRYQQGHFRLLQRFIRLLAGAGFDLAIQADFFDYLKAAGVDLPPSSAKVERLPQGCEAVISIGGDGTFLHSAAWVADSGTPIVGINTGHLGYLATFGIDNMDELVGALSAGTLRVESRAILRLVLPLDVEAPDFPLTALNEIAILKDDTSSMITVATTIDGRKLAEYRADGLIFSTATGSTGYNMSAGGPLLQPTLDVEIITPVAPHSLTLRPLVVDARAVITATTRSRAGRYRISVDGNSFTLPENTTVEIRRATHRLNMLLAPGGDFVGTLRQKLSWGLPS